MTGIQFCSACGGKLTERYLEEEERDRHVCVDCSTVHYLNPKIVAGAIPVDDGRLWLLRRAIEPRLGYWTFPAGYMELGETVEQAALRETREELSMEIRLGRLLGVYSGHTFSTVHVVYAAQALTEPGGGRETLEFASFLPHEIPWSDLAFWTTRRALEDWLAQET